MTFLQTKSQSFYFQISHSHSYEPLRSFSNVSRRILEFDLQPTWRPLSRSQCMLTTLHSMVCFYETLIGNIKSNNQHIPKSNGQPTSNQRTYCNLPSFNKSVPSIQLKWQRLVNKKNPLKIQISPLYLIYQRHRQQRKR